MGVSSKFSYCISMGDTIKSNIKSMAITNGVTVINGTDTPLTVLSKINSVTAPIPTGILSISHNGLYDITSYGSIDITTTYSADYLSIINSTTGISFIDTEYLINVAGTYAFAGSPFVNVELPICSRIENVCFYNSFSLETVSLPECKYIGDTAFGECASLSYISLPKCQSLAGWTFQNCYNLSYAYLPECISVDRPFYHCSNLTSVYMPKLFSASTYLFSGLSYLTSVNIDACTYISNSAFYLCWSLKSISLPNCSVIGTYVFYGCSSLSTFIIGTDLSYVATLSNSNALLGTLLSTTGSIYVPDSLVETYKNGTNWVYFSTRITGISNLPSA